MESKGRSGVESANKGRSLPSMPEPLNPVSMKQPAESLVARKVRGGADLGADPVLLMDKAAAHLAVTLQDSVLNKMATHGHNHNIHSHERLKDLTSRMLNGDQDKLPKLCPPHPEPPILKGADAHPASQRKATSPEIKLQITKVVAKGKPLCCEPCCGEGPHLPMATEGLLTPANKEGRKRRPILPKPPLQNIFGSSPVHPSEVSSVSQPAEVAATPQQVTQLVVKEEQGLEKEVQKEVQGVFSMGDVVWTKVSGYPWWPCLITTDPELHTHLKLRAINSQSTGIMYHVQYFGGTPERGYISEKNVVLFSGEEQYVELCYGNKQPSSRVVVKKSTSPSVPKKLHAQWVVGITQAKEAASLALEDRLAKYTFTYSADGPHLNPHLLANSGPEQTQARSQGQESSRLSPVLPSSPVQATPKDISTSLEKRQRGGSRTTGGSEKQGKQKLTASILKRKTTKKTNALVSHKGPTPSQDVRYPASETEQLEPRKLKQKSKQTQLLTKSRWKKSKVDVLTASHPKIILTAPSLIAKKVPKTKTCTRKEPLKTKPGGKKGPQKKQPSKKQPSKQSGKRALEENEEEKDQQPKKRRRVGDKPQVVAAGSSAPTKNRIRKKPETDVRKRGFASSKSLEDKEPSKPKRIRKTRQDSASSQTKKRKRATASPEPEGSGSEERPESPSDSIDETSGAKKANGGSKKESVCQVCEKAGEDVLPCEGQCCGSFHLSCVGQDLKLPGKLLCPDCTSGVHPCFSCKGSEGEMRRCGVQHCGKFYHDACLRPNPLTVFDNKGFRCPLHTCLSCHYSCRSNPKASKGKMMRCLRCPVAYHTGEMCVAAGSEMLTPTTIICTHHFTAKKGYSHHAHVNVSWCFVCSKGGQLLCCESCPAAFHPDCLNIAMPDGSWFCNDCRAGKKPKYKDIIWVKLGNYRWWPAEIQHPRNIPTNIQHLRHEIGEFPVFFFGSKDYFWMHQGRVFPYMEGDRGSKFQKTGIGKVFKNALLEAENRFMEVKMEREAKEAQENDRKPPPYKYIKVNKPCGRVQVYTADLSEIPKCNCRPTDEKPCGFESECLNRMLMYECHPQVCPSAERCCNQDFTKRLYPETKIVKTAGKGWGLVALRDIKKGEFVNEYIGELIDEEECRSRIKYYQENDITHFYMLTIDKDRIIDAGPKGNYSRFMNHSCQPNCETQKWTVNGDTRVGLFAVCDIPAGTELTFNYNLDCLGNEKTVCRCGAPNCSGFLGDRPKTSGGPATEPKGKKLKKKVKKRRSRNEGKKSEDECFRCGDGGQLVLCDKKSCTKAYHLSCLDRTKRPFGRWDCPWHHCDVCGKLSEAFCQLCPNSFCKNHQEGALRPWAPTGQLCCQDLTSDP
uniref:Nuclear receptor binding SET domain protein 2 n=1 Tax=Esox lucius TaxID=8010 RepID=A0A3P8Z936_ESOLU